MRKLTICMLLLLLCGGIHAQTAEADTIIGEEQVLPQPTDDQYRIVTNRFWDNWFVLGSVGYHAFFGDYGTVGDFGGKLSPDFNIGAGKWFTPGVGVKLQFGLGNSKGYSKEENWFTQGDQLFTDDGTAYWKTKYKWWDLNANVMLNLSRLFKGYEGLRSDKLMNQFILSLGIGALHHYGIEAQRNEWSGHVELQYSRFFTKEKALSLDVKLYTTLYQTNFDGVTLKANGEKSKWWDLNAGVRLGLTYYFKRRGWERCLPAPAPVYIVNPAPVVVAGNDCPEYGSFVFYVFFPNNYSGRDDAPTVADAPVNAIDYLASGIFTQKKFKDGEAVAARLASGASLSHLATEDVPTRKAYECTAADGVNRGYEMSDSPLSLDMDVASLKDFNGKFGYYYAPIYDGNKTWYYRVDGETATQTLLSEENYKETSSYALNAHKGLALVKEHMQAEPEADTYSFADVYAAIEGEGGVLGDCADKETVEAIRRILANGRILYVQAEGLATSQDNYTGEDAEKVGLERNRTLAYNRAYTVIKWLKGNENFSQVVGNNFSLNALTDPIVHVTDKSTRGLDAKLNRCVKVKIHYVIE